MSLYKPSSNFRFLSQGVAAAIQNKHLSCVAGTGAAGVVAPDGIPITLRAAAAPKPSRNVLRVVSIVVSCLFCSAAFLTIGFYGASFAGSIAFYHHLPTACAVGWGNAPSFRWFLCF